MHKSIFHTRTSNSHFRKNETSKSETRGTQKICDAVKVTKQKNLSLYRHALHSVENLPKTWKECSSGIRRNLIDKRLRRFSISEAFKTRKFAELYRDNWKGHIVKLKRKQRICSRSQTQEAQCLFLTKKNCIKTTSRHARKNKRTR